MGRADDWLWFEQVGHVNNVLQSLELLAPFCANNRLVA